MSFDSYHEAGGLPCGEYIGLLVGSRLVRTARKETPGIVLDWEVGVRGWGVVSVRRTLWLSPAAMRRSVGELRRVGARSVEDLNRDPPVPPGIWCRLVIADVESRDGYPERSIVSWGPLPPTVPVPADVRFANGWR